MIITIIKCLIGATIWAALVYIIIKFMGVNN